MGKSTFTRKPNDPAIPYLVSDALVCSKCLQERGGVVPSTLADGKLLMGFLPNSGGFQVWCMRHHCNVFLFEKGSPNARSVRELPKV